MSLNSLVAAYDSDSDSDSDDITSSVEAHSNTASRETLKLSKSDDTDQKVEVQLTSETSHSSILERLPNPLLDDTLPPPSLSKVAPVSDCSSVFVNTFQRAEDVKQSILERHVKLTEIEKNSESTDRHGRIIKPKVCQSFLRGSCRYGSKCKFKHDRQTDEGSYHRSYNNGPGRGWRITQHVNPREMRDFEADKNVDDYDGNVSESKKRRCGVSDSLVPPKRAMSSLNKFREEERPWTVDK